MPECLRGHGYSMDSPECRRVLGTEALHPPGGQCGIPHAQASAGTGRKPVARSPVEGELLSPTRVISVPRTRRPVWHLLRGFTERNWPRFMSVQSASDGIGNMDGKGMTGEGGLRAGALVLSYLTLAAGNVRKFFAE
eukprot:gene16126-biopygen2221